MNGILGCIHFLFVLIERYRIDVSVLGIEIYYYFPCGYICVPSDLVLLVYGVHVANGAEEELFQLLVCCLLLSQHSHVLSVNSHAS